MVSKKIVVVWLAIFSIPVPFKAQTPNSPKLPDTIAGQRVAAYIKAFNTGDEVVMRQYFASNISAIALAQRPIDARIEIYREMRGNMGELQFRRVKEASESAVTGLFQTTKGGWVEIGFLFEPQPPHKFLGLHVEDVEPPRHEEEDNTPVTLTELQVLFLIESRLNELVSADEFSGAVLLARRDKPIFQKAYGLASKEYNVPNRIDTKFNLGSINKIFTQVAVGQLAVQGKLSLDDKLGRYLPEYPNRQAAEKVTIRQLLDMTSGIGDFFGPQFDAMSKSKLRTIKDFLPLFASQPLAFEPGTNHQYSNGAYVVLGAIIEKVSGQDYYEYVRDHIFKPAGMQDAGWYEGDNPTANMASGYTGEGVGARRNNMYTRPARGSSAGGGYATAEDLLKFSIALQTDKLQLPNFREPSATGKQGSPDAKPNSFSGVGIAGGADGINAVLEVNSASGYTLVVMSNYDPPSAEKVARQIRGWLAKVKN
jgi:CubicO group peptidase (beta-lactamase class C family)